ncbi:hypothetical protein [Luteibacter sp. RCC_6_2]|uniref:hypothetical protein n=1 Tax=Luteibacter sp. RCC_6_2 TaxID=3239223 RepID=UPI0035260A41
MTVNTTTSTASYAGNGATQVFPIPFYFLLDTDLKVSYKVAATGVTSVLTLNSQYTVSGAGNQLGGTLNMSTPPASDDQLYIERNLAFIQQTAYPENNRFPSASHEKALDRNAMGLQQLDTRLGRALVRDALGISFDLAGNRLVNAGAAVNGTDMPTLDQVSTIAAGVSSGLAPDALVTKTNLASTSPGTGAALIGWPAGYGVSQAPTNQFFAQNGAGIHRFNDRVLIAGATKVDGRFPQVSNDWFSDFQNANGYTGATLNGNLVVLNNDNSNAGISFITGARSKNFTNAGTSAIGGFSIAVNDNPTLSTLAWGHYVEAHRMGANNSGTYGIEIDVRTLASDLASPNPYQQPIVNGLQIACGAEMPAAGQFDAGAAINIQSNPKSFKLGLNFGATSIVGTNGVTGAGTAIAFARGHRMVWYNSAGNITSVIDGSVSTASLGTQLRFTDSGASLADVNGNPIIQAGSGVSATANFLYVLGSTSGQGKVQLSGAGSDTNIDIKLTPKGTGRVQFDYAVATATTPSAFSATRILAIKDSSGNQFYVPCATSGW